MYQSVTPQPVVEATAPAPADYNPLLPLQGFDWLCLPQIDPSLLDPTYALPNLNQSFESYAAPNYGGFFENTFEPTFSSGMCNPGFTQQELAEMERLAIGTTFTDPFATLAPFSVDDSPFTFPTAISPFDCSGYSTGSPSSLSSGTFSSN
ncbi:hypothetical protein OG21DRAFT_1510663 [Imleria badia]|nr:hypothetical protein OG21DRAFT_1510663 [Imleria badia]